MKFARGFTLIEILVVVTIVGILASVLLANFGQGSAQSRDAKRRADLRNLQNAIEQYKLDKGVYPSGCNGTTTAHASPVWSGQIGTSHECVSGSGQYIVNLAPEYIRVLPTDPRLDGSNSGYVYTTNVNGSAYKIMALNTVETSLGESLSEIQDNDFFRCGPNYNGFVGGGSDLPWEDGAICRRVPPNGTGNDSFFGGHSTPNTCTNPVLFADTFALSGGFSGNVSNTLAKEREFLTEIVRCF